VEIGGGDLEWFGKMDRGNFGGWWVISGRIHN